jgi:hypothetical protein
MKMPGLWGFEEKTDAEDQKKPRNTCSWAFGCLILFRRGSAQQVLQQTGVLPKLTVQQQPSSQHDLQHSEQAWSKWRHFSSPLVQVIFTPFFVYSQWVWPTAKLHWQTAMPL